MIEKLGEKILQMLGEKDLCFKSDSHLEDFYEKLSQFHKISEIFPYESYDDKYQLFFNDSSVGFVLEAPPLVGSSEEMQKEINGLFQHVLPEESSLQVILYADPHIGSLLSAWQIERLGSVMEDIAKKRVDFLNQFAFNSPHDPYHLRNFRCFICYSEKDPGDNPVLIERINQVKLRIKTTLEMLGLPVNVWKASDLINTLSGIINMDFDSTRHYVKRWDMMQRISEQIASADKNLLMDKNALMLNSKKVHIRTYHVAQAPLHWSLHAMGQLIGDESRDVAQIPCPFIIHYAFYIPPQDKPKSKVLRKEPLVASQAASPLKNYVPSIRREAEELNFVKEEIAKGKRIVRTHFSVILFAREEALPNAEQILFNLYHSKMWQLESNRFFHLPVFLSSMPMMWGEDRIKMLLHHKRLKTTLSTESANLLPLQGEWKGTKTPGVILGGRRGQLMTWHPFDNDSGNYNTVVVGRSGSGKSVFMQEMMTTNLGLGGRVFVLDVGRSFEKTCFLLEGQFLEFKTKTPICINPFSSISIDDFEVAQDSLAMLKPILMLMAAPTKGVDDMEAALLEQAMLETWKAYQNETTITLIADYLSKHKEKKAQDLATMLFPYTDKGIYGRFFNGPATVNLENPMVVVELEELKERKDLQAVIIQMCIINITNRMFLGDRQTPFEIFIDEAWDLLRGAQSGVFIETLARRMRKYYGALIVGTQTINDFFTSFAAKAAFDNSDWMCLLSQKPESIEQLKKLGQISLTPQMESQLKSLKTKHGKYAEVMVYGPKGYAVGKLLLDPYSQLLYSTKADDYSKVKALRDQGISLDHALETLLEKNSEVR